MRLLYFMVFICFQIQIYAQEIYLDGFMDIKWGASREEVITKMTSEKDVEITHNTDTLVVMHGDSFLRNDVNSWFFSFFQNRFFAATVVLDIRLIIFDLHYKLLEVDLSDKYGKPFSHDSLGVYQQQTIWQFPDRNNHRNACSIYLKIEPETLTSILVTFSNHKIMYEKMFYEEAARDTSLNDLLDDFF